MEHPTPEEVAAQAMEDLIDDPRPPLPGHPTFVEGVNVLTNLDPILIFRPETVGSGMGLMLRRKDGDGHDTDQVLYLEGSMGTPTKLLSPEAKLGIVMKEVNQTLQVVHALLVGVLTKESCDEFMHKIAHRVMQEVEDPDPNVIPELWKMTAEMAEDPASPITVVNSKKSDG